MSDVATVMKKNKTEEKDGGRKDPFIYDEQKGLSKETVERGTGWQIEGEPWKCPGANIVGRGKNSAKASGVEEGKGPTEGGESCTRAGR